MSGWTDIFIYPGYQFKVLDCLITNFHLPESTLCLLYTSNRLLLLEEGGKVIWSTAQGEEKELYCTSREDGGYLSYEEVSGAVLEQYIANKFEVELQKRI